jgi:hypothetical protein
MDALGHHEFSVNNFLNEGQKSKHFLIQITKYNRKLKMY